MIDENDFWNLLDQKLLERGMTFEELSRKLLNNGNNGQIDIKRAKKIFPSIKILKKLKFLFNDDELYLICKGNEKIGYDNFSLTLKPSKEFIQKQWLRRKMQRTMK